MKYDIEALPWLLRRRLRVVDGCWLWTLSTFAEGYGKTKFRGRTASTHGKAYALLVGDPPAGMVLDHLCRNRLCCNPEHLEVVSVRENIQRGRLGVLGNHRSPYLGVTWDPKNRWRASFRLSYGGYHLGNYRSERQAACAYNAALDLLGLPGMRNCVGVDLAVADRVAALLCRHDELAIVA